MAEIDVRRGLLGRDRAATSRAIVAAALLWTCSFAAFAAAGLTPWIDLPVRFHVPVLAAMLVAAAANAVRDGGLLASALLATAPAAGYYASLAVVRLSGPVRPSLADAIGLSLLLGVPVGIVGYLFGRGMARIGSRLRRSSAA
ncbi:hypothetical protein Hbl1158_03890 [Halobaculum sp. CBA1158]|uniref:hypothetical protein n=1 Tax=Halobaculum sp. CBA1158 TaxID=2904243 RepID=UPI001F41480D|nr:hypothetical protein [Halobaculum sp. CBA1158]UIP00513.1 hypothetical protein Hbl1158_03890 [Halobaculum sp. CBA1158]